jgi:hypothetical protein
MLTGPFTVSVRAANNDRCAGCGGGSAGERGVTSR